MNLTNKRFQLLRGGVTLGGIVLLSQLLPSCVSQNQAEVERLQGELQAARNEIAALKAQQQQSQPAAEPEATAAAPAQASATAAAPAAASAAPPPPPFDDAWKAFEGEKRDQEWAFKRENDLLKSAKTHIKPYGAKVNSVQCKTTMCAVVVDVPQKPKAPYAAMKNPWAETSITSGQKAIYANQTRWTYLLERHDKDYPKFGEQRVDPLALAKSREEAAAPKTAAASPAPKPAAPKAAPAPKAPAPKATPVAAPPAKSPAKPKPAPKPPATPPPPPAPKAAPTGG